MYGLEMLKKGIIQRIENCRNIQIWRDNWIPREISLNVVTKCKRPRVRWVSKLFDNKHREWNHRLVRNIFLPVDADAILKIRIPTIEISDQFAWHFEKSGLFSVKSAYKLAYRFNAYQY
jgi:hypothetical protein